MNETTTTTPAAPPRDARADTRDGLAGGLLGAALMALAAIALYPRVVAGGGALQPLNLIGAVFHHGWGALRGFSAAATTAGLLVHVVVALALGVGITSVVRRTHSSPTSEVAQTIVASLAVWVVAEFVVLPWLDPALRQGMPPWLFAMGHIAYGFGLGVYTAYAEAHARGTSELAAAGPHASAHT